MELSSAILATTIFIFFLLPGIIFLRGLWASFKGTLSSTNFYNYLIWATLVSTIIYAFCIFAINISAILFFDEIPPSFLSYEGYVLSLKRIFELAYDFPNKSNTLFNNIYKIIALTVIADVFGFYSGKIIRNVILKYELDNKFPSLKFGNDWFYLFTARDLLYDKTLASDRFYVEVDFLCEVAGLIVIYKGIVVDYKLKDENLEYIHLVAVRRTSISKSNTESANSFIPSTQNVTVPTGLSLISGGTITAKGNVFNEGYIEAENDIKVSGSIISNSVIKAGGSIEADDIIILDMAKNQTGTSITSPTQNNISESLHSNQNTNLNPPFFQIMGGIMIFKASAINNINVTYREFPI